MVSLSSSCLSAHLPLLNPSKSYFILSNYFLIPDPNLLISNSSSSTNEIQTPTSQSINTSNYLQKNLSFLNSHHKVSLKPHSQFFSSGFLPHSHLSPSKLLHSPLKIEVSSKFNLESILVSNENFFNRYPFFVATVAFTKSLAVLGSPSLKFLSKSVVQVEFREGDEEGFVKRVLENFGDPINTTVCIIDNFDGNSLKAAELLVKKGFKEAYAIRGGIRGEKRWLDIQETLLPQSVHIFPTKSVKKPKQLDSNGGITPHNGNIDDALSINTGSIADNNNNNNNKDLSSTTVQSKVGQRPQPPYPNNPDLKPPSSPTPSKPQ